MSAALAALRDLSPTTAAAAALAVVAALAVALLAARALHRAALARSVRRADRAAERAAHPRPRPVRRHGLTAGRVVLGLVGVAGAILSFDNLRRLALSHGIDHRLAWAYPSVLDLLIAGCTIMFVDSVHNDERPIYAFRIVAHLGVAGTVVLNAVAGTGNGVIGVLVDVFPPLAWSLVIELASLDATRAHRARHPQPAEPTQHVPWELWTAMTRTAVAATLHMARVPACRNYAEAIVAVYDIDAAKILLRFDTLAAEQTPDAGEQLRRRVLGLTTRMVRVGSLPSQDLLDITAAHAGDPAGILRAVVAARVAPTLRPARRNPAPAPAPRGATSGAAHGASAPAPAPGAHGASAPAPAPDGAPLHPLDAVADDAPATTDQMRARFRRRLDTRRAAPTPKAVAAALDCSEGNARKLLARWKRQWEADQAARPAPAPAPEPAPAAEAPGPTDPATPAVATPPAEGPQPAAAPDREPVPVG
jgi:hypothetical protein